MADGLNENLNFSEYSHPSYIHNRNITCVWNCKCLPQ